MAVQNLANKLVMSMFSPVSPFFELSMGTAARLELAERGVEEAAIPAILAENERQAAKFFGSSGQRAKMYRVAEHLIVLGNALIVEESPTRLRVLGLRNWAVERDFFGDVQTLVIAEPYLFRNLQPQVQEVMGHRYANGDTRVTHYRVIQREGHGGFTETRAIDNVQLPDEFTGYYAADRLPYHVPTWDLQDGDHYGTGLVERFIGDLESLERLDEGLVNSGVLATQFRWLADPTKGVRVVDFQNSVTGEAIPGTKDGLTTVSAGMDVAHSLRIVQEVASARERRVGQAFLLAGSVVRDSERTTAEEVRLVMREFENTHSGTFSTAAVNWQRPMARWALRGIGVHVEDLGLDISIPSGLEGLARQHEVDNFRAAVQDLTAVATMPEEHRQELSPTRTMSFVGAGRGIRLEKLFLSEEEKAARAAAAGQEAGLATAAAEATAGPV